MVNYSENYENGQLPSKPSQQGNQWRDCAEHLEKDLDAEHRDQRRKRGHEGTGIGKGELSIWS